MSAALLVTAAVFGMFGLAAWATGEEAHQRDGAGAGRTDFAVGIVLMTLALVLAYVAGANHA